MPRPPINKNRPYTPKTGKLAGRTFYSERQYRNALAQEKGFGSWYQQQRQAKRVSGKAYAELRPAEKQGRRRALDALARMRKGASLTKAAKESHTTPNTVMKWAGQELERTPGTSWTPKKSDRLYRRMVAVTTEGLHEVEVRSSRQASLIAEHMNAVKHYLRTGNDGGLRRLEGEKVAGRQLETDPEKIADLERTGELEFEDIYESSL